MAAGELECPPRLIVGLGNPGKKYADTRHNIGFMVLDHLAEKAGVNFAGERRWKTQIAKDGARYLLKPQTFMNDSGVAVAKAAAFYKIDPSEVLVIYDDLDLSLGRLRLRGSGSAGGHNGMRSIISHLGTQSFPRLRIGIGRTGMEAVGHVLGKFRDEERSELEKSVKNAVLAVALIVGQGLSAAMTRFNAPPAVKKQPRSKPDGEERGAGPEQKETPNE